MELERKIIQARQERKDKIRSTKVGLRMFEADALETGQLDPLVDSFFGKRAYWLAANLRPENRQTQEHEDRVKDRYLRRHPDITPDEYQEVRRGQLETYKRNAKRSINRRFTEAVSERFDVPRNPEAFANKRLYDAGDAMRVVADTLYPDNRSLHPRNEVVLLPISPASVVELVASENTDPALRREEVMRHLHAFVAAEHKRGNGKLEAEKKIAQIQSLFASELFDGPRGTTEEVVIKAIFDDTTTYIDSVSGIDADFDETTIPEGKHLKSMPIAMRRVRESGMLVLTNPDTKTLTSAEIKAISRAHERVVKGGNDDVIPTDIHDTHRILFTVYGDDKDRDAFVTQVRELLIDKSSQRVIGNLNGFDEPELDSDGFIKGRVLRVEDDSNTNGYKTQASVQFRRLQVYFDGLHAPVEIKIQTIHAKLEDDLSVGELNPETGFYDGTAHALYRIRRANSVRKYYSPEEIRGSKHDLSAEIMRTQEKVVFQLRNRAR